MEGGDRREKEGGGGGGKGVTEGGEDSIISLKS